MPRDMPVEPISESSASTDAQEVSDLKPARTVGGLAAARLNELLGGHSANLEILCGITVALALVPEAVAFALSAGLTPFIGLNTAWIIAFITAIIGGRPAMICGATGSIAVLLGDTVETHGVEYLFYAVILMGIIEIGFGLLRAGSLVELIPVPVMIGFCNGLALVIGLAQFSNFKDPEAKRAASPSRRLSSFSAFTDDVPFISGEPMFFAVIITAIALLVSLFLPKLTKRVPSALVAIVMGTAFEWLIVRPAFGSHTPIVQDVAALGGSFPLPVWSDRQYQMPPLNMETLRIILPLSITMASVGLLESLMTLNLIDEITKTQGSTLRECVGQGVANAVCGMFGGMGGCAMIGQSMINVGSGARTRLSSACAGIVLLLIILVGYPAINIIPVSALVGVMFNVVFHTFEWRSMKLILLAALPKTLRERFFSETRSKQKIRRADAVVIVVVTLVTLFTDLAIAVLCGMVFSCFMFVYDSATLITVNCRDDVDTTSGRSIKYYDVHGILFFGSAKRFLALFDEAADPDDVRLVFDAGYVADFTAIEALNKLGERYGTLGKRVTLQQLKPNCSKIVSKSSGLLVKELGVSLETEEILPTKREHFNVESFAGPEHALLEGSMCTGHPLGLVAQPDAHAVDEEAVCHEARTNVQV